MKSLGFFTAHVTSSFKCQLERRLIPAFVAFVCTVTAFAQTTLPSGMGISFYWTNPIPVGDTMVWRLVLTNGSSSAKTCRVTLDANAYLYNGEFLREVSTVFATNTLAPAASVTNQIKVSPLEYTNGLGVTRTFETSAFVRVEGGDEMWVETGRIVLSTRSDIVSVSPSLPIHGSNLTVTVNFQNPLPVPLHNVSIWLTADGGFSTNGTITKCNWTIGQVGTNAPVLVSTNLVAHYVGTNYISAYISANELDEVEGNVRVRVVAP